MQSNALENFDAIDTAMASFPQYGTGELLGIDVSPIRSSTRERLKRTHSKHQFSAIHDTSGSGRIEAFESRMLLSSTAIDANIAFNPLEDASLQLNNDAKISTADHTSKLVLSGNGYAEVPQQAAVDFNTGDFTISTSVTFERSGDIEMIVTNMAGGSQQGYMLRRHGDGTIEFGIGQNFSLNQMHCVKTSARFNDLHHPYEITALREGTSLRIFIDGEEQSTKLWEGTPNTYDVSNGAPITIGGISWADVYRLKGEIGSLALRNGAFTPTEIAELLKVQNSPAVSQETVNVIAAIVAEQQSVQPQIETYTEPEFVSFSNIPNGLYAPGQFHIVNLTPEIKIRVYSDAMFEVDNGVIASTAGSGNDWIHVSLAEGQSAIPVSSVRVRYNPYGGGAQGQLHVLSEDDENRVIKLSQEGDIPVVGPVKRVLLTLEGHRGALLGMTINVTKTREIASVSQEPKEAIASLNAETLTTIAEVVASQEAESVMGPIAPETVDEHLPLLRIVALQGSNITLAVSSPMTGGNSVRFTNLQDDGLFTNTVIQGTADGSITPVSLGMNAANGTGNYRIVLAGGPNASTLASVEVHWDRDSKKLSLAGNEKLWESSEAVGKAMNAQTQEVLALAQNPMVGSGVLAAMQQESLIEGVRMLPSSGISIPQFESSFWNAHPEWKEDAIHETAIRESKTSRSTATQIFNRIVTQRNDTMSILRDAYSRYYSHLGDLLQEGVRVLSAVRNSGNEPDIRRNFAILVDQISTNLTMFKLSGIGIRIPDANTVLEAVKSVWTERCEELIALKTGEIKIATQQTYRAQLVENKFVQSADGTMVAADDPRATTGLVYYTDPEGRLTLLPQGTTDTLSTQTTSTALVADINNTQTYLSKERLYLTVGAGKDVIDPLQLTVQPKKSSLIEFHLDDEKMVSFGVPGIFGRNLTLRLTGTGLPAAGYVAEKAGTTGESVSLRLQRGDYKLVVQDSTDYSSFYSSPLENQSFPVNIETNIKPYHSAKIEGLISIEGNTEVMPVGMSVAEFNMTTGERRENPNHGLDPNKPVWVVVHGMNSKESPGNINEAIKALKEEGMQVVSINWNLAAKDGTKTGLDVVWTDSVGQWVAQQLASAGFSPAMINGWGHSHGTYVLDAMAKELMKLKDGVQMNTLIASDPAGNIPLWTGYDHTKINFSNVSMRSIAFESSFIADSDFLAGTADIAIHIDGPSEFSPLDINGLPQFGPVDEHSLGLTTLTAIMKHEKNSPGDFSQFLSFEKITHFTQEDIDKQFKKNSYRGRFEGVIDAKATMITDGEHQYLQGDPVIMRYKKTETDKEESILFTTFA